MTTAVAPDRTLPLLGGRNHFLIRRLHSLTGIVFGGYLVVHLLVNATIAQMGTHFQVQVDKIHALPFVWAIEWVAIYLPILFHTIYGAWIIFTGQPNVDRYRYTKNYFYVAQRISAFVIVAFMIFHVFALKVGMFGTNLSFDPHNAAATVHRHMSVSWVLPWIVYPVGILASCYHLANGFWTAAITWGLTISAAAQKRWGYACAGLFAFTFICGMIALVASTNPKLAEPKAHTVEYARDMNEELIKHFADGGEKLSLAIRGLTRDDLLCMPDPAADVGKWSIQQVVIHCMDSDLIGVDRLKRMIAEENPTIVGYDENKFVANLFYDEQAADQAVEIIDLNRKLFTGVLKKLGKSAWDRKGTHNERGVITVGGYLKSTVDHLDHHINFIHKKRARMGKEMW